MDNKNVRPTFGVNLPTNTTNSSREEVGAIWQRLTKNNRTYFNIKLNITKAKLQEILASTSTEEVNLSLIAFPNDRKQDGDNKPAFCIYEEQKK